jgi:Tol biopolymer transport system component
MKAQRPAASFGVALLLAACTGGPPEPEAAAPAPLPTADTGRIDVDALEGRFTFSAGADEEIYVSEADGSGVTQLTHNRAADFDPTWSPDGSLIAFRSQRDGNDEIYVVQADGEGSRNITNHDAVDWGPDWSPDGDLIAFNSGRVNPLELYGFVTDPRGREVRRVGGDTFFEYPAWSPDGTRIAFMHQTFDRAGGNYEIYVMNADGTGIRRLTNHPADDGWPAWSPDGTRIAFSSLRHDCAYAEAPDCEEGPHFHALYVMNVDGTGLRRVTEVYGQFAAWSPDGRFIAVTPAPGGIYVMRPDGSDLTLVPVDVPADPLFPDWVA